MSEIIFDWFICFLLPCVFYSFSGMNAVAVYVGCMIIYALIRIGNKLR